MKLLTLSDGFGDSNAVPSWYVKYWKWPKLIELMTKGTTVTNFSRYGAGNEFIVNQLKHNVDNVDKVIVQWAQPDRLDLLLAHNQQDFWNNVIASDTVYNNNIVQCGDNSFWISSNSKTSAVREYHQRYITVKQHQMRSQIYIEYAKLLLDQRGIDYRFMLVDDSEYIGIDANWICHDKFKGMRSFRSKYSNLDLGFVQPIPLVAFDFIKQYVMPSIDLHWRNSIEISAVENMLYRHYEEAIKNRND